MTPHPHPCSCPACLRALDRSEWFPFTMFVIVLVAEAILVGWWLYIR